VSNDGLGLRSIAKAKDGQTGIGMVGYPAPIGGMPPLTGPALGALKARLCDNQIASIAAVKDPRRPVAVPCLNGSLALGPGAPNLAHQTGAALLPVFSSRNAVSPSIVTVGPSLNVRRDLPRGDTVEKSVRQYPATLDPHDRERPDWRSMNTRGGWSRSGSTIPTSGLAGERW
jgi:hypothetical protein